MHTAVWQRFVSSVKAVDDAHPVHGGRQSLGYLSMMSSSSDISSHLERVAKQVVSRNKPGFDQDDSRHRPHTHLKARL